jgi:hypothetical protein
MVEDPPHFVTRFNNWNQFILSEEWNRNYIYGCLPAYWIWVDSEDEEYEDFSFDNDELTLVYLSLAPCNARVIRIDVDKNDEEDIKQWLTHHNFLHIGG